MWITLKMVAFLQVSSLFFAWTHTLPRERGCFVSYLGEGDGGNFFTPISKWGREVEDVGGERGEHPSILYVWTLKRCFDFSQTHINFFLMLFKRWFGLSVSKNWQRVSEVSRYNCQQCQGWNCLWSSMYLLWTICMSIICILYFGQSMFHQVRIYNQVI